ncbi:MAG: hypothetical protein HYY45_11535 [Deltaproteobacteria bacterium]|nr:hypothetical protein [Deltaproteobacteria bacterium]
MALRILRGEIASLGLVIALSAFVPAGAHAGSTTIAQAAEVARIIERKWQAEGLRSDDKQTGQMLAEASRTVTEHLLEHGDDVEALILGAKLEFFALDASPALIDVGPGKPPLEEQFRPRAAAIQLAHERLDRAIRLLPDSAEAHFWKSRVYMLKALVTRDGMTSLVENMDGALREMQLALQLDPGSERYAMQVVWMLMQYRQDVSEAARVAKGLRQGTHPLARLLARSLPELAAIPLPEDSMPWPAGLESASRFIATPQLPLRTVLRLVPGRIDRVEAFFAKHWSGFVLHEVEPGNTKYRGQWLHWRDGQIEPATIEQFRAMKGYPSHGMVMIVFESDQLPADESARTNFPIPPDRIYCILMITNMRSAPDP